MYLLKLALRPYIQAPAQQVMNLLSISLILFLFGLMVWSQMALGPVIHRLQHEQVITAYVAPTLDPADEGKLVDTIRVAAGAASLNINPNEKMDIQLVDSSSFLKEISASYPELHDELIRLGSEMSRVVPRYVSVSGIFREDLLSKVKALPGIEQAESSTDRYAHIVGAYRGLSWAAFALSLGLVVAILTGLFHIARLNSNIHSEVARLMKLWGAKTWQVYTPALLNGAITGFLSAIMAAVVWIVASQWVGPGIKTLSPVFAEIHLSHMSFTISVLFLVTGLIAGLGTSAMSSVMSRRSK